MRLKYIFPLLALLVLTFPVGCIGSGGDSQGPEASLKLEIDPVCKMKVNPDTARGSSEHSEKMYYFCSEHCKESFEKEPDKFLETI